MNLSRKNSISETRVQAAYAPRAAEYTQLLGDVAQMDATDVALIKTWGQQIDGPILDAGCGPGHWTHLLSADNPHVTGIDIVPEFIALAAQRFPGTRFQTMNLEHPACPDDSFSGLLAWYSMIHLERTALPSALDQCSRVLRTGGTLLLGFFNGASWQRFPHAVTDAFYWSIPEVRVMLGNSGFRVDEVHTRTSHRHRDHGAIVATKVA